MKKIILLLIVIPFLFVGCLDLFDSDDDGTNAGENETGMVSTSSAFDFSLGEETTDYDSADMVLEPWWSNGEPMPALQLIAWGDSTKDILDMGAVSLDLAIDMELSEGTHDYDWWDIWPIKEGHTYTFIENEGTNRIYMYVDSVVLSNQTDNSYSATMYFTYRIEAGE